MSTGISWTDETWTVVTGCSKVSAGCKNCYAESLAARLAAMGKEGYTPLPWTARNAAKNVTLRPERLEQPLRWRKPRRVFVTSMGDLFHELVPFEFVDWVFAVMALAPRHTFQVLTKRPERMAEYLNANDGSRSRKERVFEMCADYFEYRDLYDDPSDVWPLPNVQLGTSVEDQDAADERIPHLLRTPAASRFLSCEPLLGPVDLMKDYPSINSPGFSTVALSSTLLGGQRLRLVDWVIAGGESGPRFRPMRLEWIRDLRDQCEAAGVAFFAKQDSGRRNEMPLPEDLQQREFPETGQTRAGRGAS